MPCSKLSVWLNTMAPAYNSSIWEAEQEFETNWTISVVSGQTRLQWDPVLKSQKQRNFPIRKWERNQWTHLLRTLGVFSSWSLSSLVFPHNKGCFLISITWNSILFCSPRKWGPPPNNESCLLIKLLIISTEASIYCTPQVAFSYHLHRYWDALLKIIQFSARSVLQQTSLDQSKSRLMSCLRAVCWAPNNVSDLSLWREPFADRVSLLSSHASIRTIPQ